MFDGFWLGFDDCEVFIILIINGVHVFMWVDYCVFELVEKYFGYCFGIDVGVWDDVLIVLCV